MNIVKLTPKGVMAAFYELFLRGWLEAEVVAEMLDLVERGKGFENRRFRRLLQKCQEAAGQYVEEFSVSGNFECKGPHYRANLVLVETWKKEAEGTAWLTGKAGAPE